MVDIKEIMKKEIQYAESVLYEKLRQFACPISMIEYLKKLINLLLFYYFI